MAERAVRLREIVEQRRIGFELVGLLERDERLLHTAFGIQTRTGIEVTASFSSAFGLVFGGGLTPPVAQSSVSASAARQQARMVTSNLHYTTIRRSRREPSRDKLGR